MVQKRNLVVDSSVAVKWLNKHDEAYVTIADNILKDFQDKKIQIMMPELAKYEVGNALLYKHLPLLEALDSIGAYHSTPIQFIPQDQAQAQSAMQIAYENKISFYDASFMALAMEQKADLVTDNPKHQQKKIEGLKVIVLKDY